jgi:hypothetical protein
LCRFPIGEEKSRAWNKSSDILKALTMLAETIVVKNEKEETLSVKKRFEHGK